MADSAWLLIASRMVTGVAAGFMTPIGLSIIATRFSEGEERNRALLFYAGFAAGGFSIGLAAGGLLTSVDWRWTFFAPVVLGLVLFIAALRVIPPDRPVVSGRFDLPGAVLLTVGMMLAVLAIVRLPDVAVLETAVTALAATVALLAFLREESRTAEPLVPPALLRNPSVLRTNLAAALWVGSFTAFQFVTVLYFQDVKDWSPLVTGLALMPVALDAFLAPTIGAKVMERLGVQRTIALGVAFGIAGYAAFLQVDAASSYAVMLPTMLLLALGFTFVYGPMTVAATQGVPDEDQGVASGLINAAFQFGAAFGLAVAAAVVVAASDGAGTVAGLVDAYRVAWLVPVAGTVVVLLVTLRRVATAAPSRPAASPSSEGAAA